MIGDCGLSYKQARAVSAYELNARYAGHARAIEEKMGLVRMLAFYVVAPHTSKFKEPSDLFKLPSERAAGFNEGMSREEIEADIKRKTEVYKAWNSQAC